MRGDMDAWMAAGLAAWEQIVRDRQARLRAEARDERLGRVARVAREAPASTPTSTNRPGSGVPRPGLATMGGPD